MAPEQLINGGGRYRFTDRLFKFRLQLHDGKAIRVFGVGNETRQQFRLFVQTHAGVIAQLFFCPDLVPRRDFQ